MPRFNIVCPKGHTVRTDSMNQARHDSLYCRQCLTQWAIKQFPTTMTTVWEADALPEKDGKPE